MIVLLTQSKILNTSEKFCADLKIISILLELQLKYTVCEAGTHCSEVDSPARYLKCCGKYTIAKYSTPICEGRVDEKNCQRHEL